jgi:chromosome segregation ATPase
VDQQLAQAREREGRLVAAQRDEPAKFDAFAKRIAELDARLAALTPRVTALAAEQQQQVQAIAIAELQGQQQRLAEYRTQARFALAQLVDRALTAQTGDAAKENRNAPRR